MKKTKMTICLFYAALIFLILLPANNMTSEDLFDLQSIEGFWEGKGKALIPKTGIPISIYGKAHFIYDTIAGYLRTELTGSKLFFTYSDSGHLSLDRESGKAIWEVWDSFGKYSLYEGAIEPSEESDILRASCQDGDKTRYIEILFPHKDGLTFSMTTHFKKGKVRKNAFFELHREK